MKINLVDSTFSHCGFSNNPLPVINTAENIEWIREDSKDKLVIYTDNQISDHSSKESIAWLLEPRQIKAAGYKYIEKNYEQFKNVWTYDKDLINSIPNAIFYPFGGCWIEYNQRKIHSKSKLFSIISSNKTKTTGHRLRHQIVNAGSNNIDVYGRGYKLIDNKITGLKDYYYHLVVENVKKDYFFTEKLIDSFVTGTIPIYWGCPSIGDFFNTEGMIIFNDLLELRTKLKQCTVEFYQQNISAITENFKLAKEYTLAENWIYNNILSND